jgi:hypothetical protein
LDEYRKSMGNPEVGVVFHSGNGLPISMDQVGRRVIRPALEARHLPWYGWHAFRRGLASNLYAMGAQDKVVQRVLSAELRNRKILFPAVSNSCQLYAESERGTVRSKVSR